MVVKPEIACADFFLFLWVLQVHPEVKRRAGPELRNRKVGPGKGQGGTPWGLSPSTPGRELTL